MVEKGKRMSLDKQKVLRVNCPGYGHQSNFSSGCAQPLYEYTAIVVNPVSILHLFDKDPEMLQQIEEGQLEGSHSYSAKSDKLIESLNPEIEQRLPELVKFLEQGGLLVYFLCRPFMVQGPSASVAMDNYSWLDMLAPDKPKDNNERHMASTTHGKNIEVTAEGGSSPFARYLRQTGLEWTTLIRTENLTERYQPLAIAGPNKVISAYINVGLNGGMVAFLPAPYTPQYDDTLVTCLELWETRRAIPNPDSKAFAAASEAPPAQKAAPEEASSPEPAGLESPSEVSLANAAPSEQPSAWSEPEAGQAGQQAADWHAPAANWKESAASWKEPAAHWKEPAASPEEPAASCEETAESCEEPAALPKEPASAEPEQCHDKEEVKPSCCQSELMDAEKKEPEVSWQSSPPAQPESKVTGNHHDEPETKPSATQHLPGAGDDIVPKAKDLIEKMEEISSKTPLPDWCQKYSFADLDQMRDELAQLNETIRSTQQKIEKVQVRIRSMEGLKNALLTADGDELYQSCTKVFEQLGWKVKAAPSYKGEFWLMDGESTAAIVRIIRSASRPKNADLAQLAESIISYWGEHEEEPKGVLLASTYANRPPIERTEEDYSDAITEFAQKKNLCLMTSLQLLSIYRDLEGGGATAKDLKEQILLTSGRLPGFSLDPRVATTA